MQARKHTRWETLRWERPFRSGCDDELQTEGKNIKQITQEMTENMSPKLTRSSTPNRQMNDRVF